MIIVLMGVSGCGKTTIGTNLARRLNWEYQEGDDLHPQTNILKMSEGIPLNDDDRKPWIARIADWNETRCKAGRDGQISIMHRHDMHNLSPVTSLTHMAVCL